MQVSIDRCFLKGTQAAIVEAQKSLQQIRFPAVGDAEYVIIRQLNIAAPSYQLALNYARQTEKILAAKVSGWSPNAASADCVWFASEADLYACLCRDIALGHASDLWFWQQFVHDLSGVPEQQIFQVWQQQRTHLAALITQLHEKQHMPLVWRQMGSLVRTQVLHTLVPAPMQTALSQSIKVVQQKPTQNLAPGTLPTLLTTLLDEISSDQTADQADLQLAVALYLLANRPHQAVSQIAQPEIEKLFILISQQRATLIEQLIPQTEQSLVDSSTQVETPGADAKADMASKQAENQLVQPNEIQTWHTDNDLPGSVNKVAYSEVQPQPVIIKPAANEVQAVEQTGSEPEPEGELFSEQTSDQWYVQQGGLFYLLNILNQAPIRERLLDDPQAVAFPSGWGWLYRLGEAFGLAYERELVRCLARLANLEEDEFVRTMPKLEAANEILDYAAQRYQGFSIWQSALMQKPAHISFMRPELDIRFKMQDLDIELRKSGLDINPGWIDWLGAMVRFHYRDFI